VLLVFSIINCLTPTLLHSVRLAEKFIPYLMAISERVTSRVSCQNVTVCMLLHSVRLAENFIPYLKAISERVTSSDLPE
jgi:hypothetical protein